MASRRKFTPEYKAEAVALVIESGRSVKDVADSLGIHEHTLGIGSPRRRNGVTCRRSR
ncbi:MAG: transposase [Pseudonocardiaceae bacterium]